VERWLLNSAAYLLAVPPMLGMDHPLSNREYVNRSCICLFVQQVKNALVVRIGSFPMAQFNAPLHLRHRAMSPLHPRRHAMSVRSSLIDSDGGVLVDLAAVSTSSDSTTSRRTSPTLSANSASPLASS
jgi:hypothetical protein